VNDEYDNKDIVVSTDHVFQEMVPEDQLSKNMANLNRASTRVNESRDVTLLVPEKPHYRKIFPGVKLGERIKNW